MNRWLLEKRKSWIETRERTTVWMLNHDDWFTEVVWYRGASKHTAITFFRSQGQERFRTFTSFLQACVNEAAGHLEHFIRQTFLTSSVIWFIIQKVVVTFQHTHFYSCLFCYLDAKILLVKLRAARTIKTGTKSVNSRYLNENYIIHICLL